MLGETGYQGICRDGEFRQDVEFRAGNGVSVRGKYEGAIFV